MKNVKNYSPEKAILTEENGSKRTVYVQERGNVVSEVSSKKHSSWKTTEIVATRRLSSFDDEDDSSFSSSGCGSDDGNSTYSSMHYNEEGEFLGGSLRND
jgi:hypothetical protein